MKIVRQPVWVLTQDNHPIAVFLDKEIGEAHWKKKIQEENQRLSEHALSDVDKIYYHLYEFEVTT